MWSDFIFENGIQFSDPNENLSIQLSQTLSVLNFSISLLAMIHWRFKGVIFCLFFLGRSTRLMLRDFVDQKTLVFGQLNSD